MNKLYFGDNLDVLRRYVDDASVDLIYLDPPFNSEAKYNVLFETPDSEKGAAQAEAFRDTWTWGEEAGRSLDEIMTEIRGGTARFIDALRSALGSSDMMAYLVMMAVRLHELHRVLKADGSLYLHCDPTPSSAKSWSATCGRTSTGLIRARRSESAILRRSRSPFSTG